MSPLNLKTVQLGLLIILLLPKLGMAETARRRQQNAVNYHRANVIHETAMRRMEVKSESEITIDRVKSRLGITDPAVAKAWRDFLVQKNREVDLDAEIHPQDSFLRKFADVESSLLRGGKRQAKELWDNVPRDWSTLKLTKLPSEVQTLLGQGGAKELLATDPLIRLASMTPAPRERILTAIHETVKQRGDGSVLPREAIEHAVSLGAQAHSVRDNVGLPSGVKANETMRKFVAETIDRITKFALDNPHLAKEIAQAVRESWQRNVEKGKDMSPFLAEMGVLNRMTERFTVPAENMSHKEIFKNLTGKDWDSAKLTGSEKAFKEGLEKLVAQTKGEIGKLFKGKDGNLAKQLREATEKGEAEAKKLKAAYEADLAFKTTKFLVESGKVPPKETCRTLACILTRGLSAVATTAILPVFMLAVGKLRQECPSCEIDREVMDQLKADALDKSGHGDKGGGGDKEKVAKRPSAPDVKGKSR